MIIALKPASHLCGTVVLPASKSYSIRAFLIAACGGSSSIIGPSDCDDAKASCRVARQLGAKVKRQTANKWVVKAGVQRKDMLDIAVGESGTVLRFLLPLLPLSCQRATIRGTGTLRGRPNLHLTEILRRQGVVIHGRGPQESVPIIFSGGRFRAGTMRVTASLSSQFISALLIACPKLKGETHLILQGRKLVSSDYITMTRQVLKCAGVYSRKINERNYIIKGGQLFGGLGYFRIPSDYGLAAFLLAAGALLPSQLTLRGYFPAAFIQADSKIADFLKQMGVRFALADRAVKICGPFSLRGGEFSLKTCPDLVPIMAVLALFAKGKTRLYDIQHVRFKESDRISDLRQELLKIGAGIVERKNDLTIFPRERYRQDVLLDPHQDHRLAMAFSVLGLKLGVKVKDAQCVRKSYPKFFQDLRKVGVKVHYS